MAAQPKVTPRGQLIRRLRAEKGSTTQERFASDIGVDVRLLRAAETGKPSTPKTIHAIARGLGVEYDDLVIRTVDRTASPPHKDPDLEYFIVGFRKDKDISDATVSGDAHPLIKWLLSQPNIAYAAYMYIRPIASITINIELSLDTVLYEVLPAFAAGALNKFDITALHFLPDLVNAIVQSWHTVTTVAMLPQQLSTCVRNAVIPLPVPSVTIAEDGSAILTPSTYVKEEVLV